MLMKCIKNQIVIVKLSISLFFLGAFVFSYNISFAEGKFVYESKGKRNPFISLVTPDGRLLRLDKEEPTGDLSLEGIIFDKSGASYAIINEAVVSVGDIVGDAQIVKIEANSVIYIKDGKISVVELKKEEQ